MSHRPPTGHRAPRHRGAARLVALFAVLALVAGACSRVTTTSPPGMTAARRRTAGSGGTGGTGGEAGPGDFGDLKAVCGPAEGDNADDTAQGVTSDEIHIGTISDPGYVGRPGPEPGALRRQRRVRGLVQRGRRHQRPQDQDRQARRQAHRVQAAHQRGLRRGLRPRRRRRRVRRHRPGRAAHLPAARLPGLRRVAQGPRRRPAGASRCRARSTRCRSASTATSTRSSRTRPTNVGFMTGNVATTVSQQAVPGGGVKTLGCQTVYETQYNAVGEPTWTPFAQAMQEQGRQGPLLRRRAGEPRPSCSRRCPRHRLQARLGRWSAPTIVRPGAHRGRRVGAPERQHRVVRPCVPPFLADAGAGHPAVRGPLREVPAQRQDPGARSASTRSPPGCCSPPSAKSCGADLTRTCVYDERPSRDHGVDRSAASTRPANPATLTGSDRLRHDRRGLAATGLDCDPTTSSPPTGFVQLRRTTRSCKLEGDYGDRRPRSSDVGEDASTDLEVT